MLLPGVDLPKLVGDVRHVRLAEDANVSGSAGGPDVAGPDDVLDAVQRLAEPPGDLPDRGDWCGGW